MDTNPVRLKPEQISRLKACMMGSGLELIEGLPEVSQELRLADVSGEAIISEKNLPAARNLAMLGLREELGYIEGLCESGMFDVVDKRITAPYGLQGIVDVIARLNGAELDAASYSESVDIEE